MKPNDSLDLFYSTEVISVINFSLPETCDNWRLIWDGKASAGRYGRMSRKRIVRARRFRNRKFFADM
jgi:hypothetical protein